MGSYFSTQKSTARIRAASDNTPYVLASPAIPASINANAAPSVTRWVRQVISPITFADRAPVPNTAAVCGSRSRSATAMYIWVFAAYGLTLHAALTCALANAQPSITAWADASSSSWHCRAVTSATNANRSAAAIASDRVAAVSAQMSSSSLIPAKPIVSNICASLPNGCDAGHAEKAACG